MVIKKALACNARYIKLEIDKINTEELKSILSEIDKLRTILRGEIAQREGNK
ncbi:MAG: hypothetical protein ACRCX2_13430 [Paraclostridium sp.]